MQSERRSKFRAKELAIVMSHYDVGAILEIHSFRRGNIHSPKSVIHTDRGKYLLKRRAPGLDDPYRVALAHDVQLFLTKKHFPLPQLIGTKRSNSSMLQTHGAIYELYAFAEGQAYKGNQGQTQSAGAALARLQQLLKDFQSNYEVPGRSYHDENRVRESIEQVAPGISKHDSVSGQEGQLPALCASLLAAYDDAVRLAREALATKPQRLVCHGDWHPGNMLFRNDAVGATFDYDTVRWMSPWEDVANGCLQFSLQANGSDPEAWPAEMDVERAVWFLRGYNDGLHWDEALLQMLLGLMIEALVAESVTPIAATGRFANIQGFRFLRMILRKVHWLENNALDALKTNLQG